MMAQLSWDLNMPQKISMQTVKSKKSDKKLQLNDLLSYNGFHRWRED